MFSGGIEKGKWCEMDELFHDGGPYHIETSPLICSANQWTDFYMIGTSVMSYENYTVNYADFAYCPKGTYKSYLKEIRSLS